MKDQDPPKKKGVKRRKFLKYSGIGLGVVLGGVWLTRNMLRRTLFELSEKTIFLYLSSDNPKIWFEITTNNEIILHSSKVEMGQGTFTSLAQLAADELEVDVEKIKVIHAATATENIDQYATGGSMSIPSLYNPIREMAATMREMLKAKAAEKMGMEKDAVSAVNGTVSGNGKSMTYGEIVMDVEDWKIPKTPKLKPRSEWKYIGKAVPRVDLHDKVVGAPIFGMDAHRPDLLFGSVVRPRKVDAKMVNFDIQKAEKMPGVVKVVQQNGFVGVVAHSFVEADNARKQIKFDYEVNKEWNLADIKKIVKVGNGKKTIVQKEGKPVEDVTEEGETYEIEFSSPIGAHAQMEPNGALADYKDGKVTVELSTQVVAHTQKEVAKALGIKAADVNVIPTFLGGGFGRRLHTPNAVQAAIMSREVGKPVKCFFDRKQEFQNDTFRPPTHHVMKGKMSLDGKLLAIEHNIASGDVMFNSALAPSIAIPILRADIGSIRGGAIMYRAIPNYRATYYHNDLPFATSFWRSLGLLANTFAIESFIDEMALRSKRNPVELRLENIPNDVVGERLRKVISTCAKNSNYKDTVVDGKAMGFAASVDIGSPCAHVAEVSIVDNNIKVHKVTVAFDCGIAVNPDQVKAQIEGCIIMGISASLFEKMDLRDNKLYPIIYGAYKMALMKDAPREINIELIEGADFAGPVGEPPLGPIAAAIGNALRRLTGNRLKDLPLSLS